MKQVAVTGERQAALVDVKDPKPVEDWALVKVHAAPMCTEFKAFESGKEVSSPGHEAAGEVVEVARPGRVRVGDRVVVMPHCPCGACSYCRSGEFIYCQDKIDFTEFTGGLEGSATMAQYLLKPDWLLPAIPDGVSYEHASLACCGLGPTFGAFERIGLSDADTLLLTGLGPVGLGSVINAAARGARVICVEPNPWRASLAIELGAETVLDPGEGDALQQIRDLTDGLGPDKAMDCSGTVAAHRLCIDAVRPRGIVAFVGECRDETPVKISDDMIRKGLTLMGSWHYSLKDFPRVMQTITGNSEKVKKFITHTFPFAEIQQAWETQLSGECGKVILKPWE